MWSTYAGGEFGVAIRTSYEKLDRHLPVTTHGDRALMIGMVKNGDYDPPEYTTDPINVFSALMSKRDAFQDEREVRMLCDNWSLGLGVAEPGFCVPVDWNQLALAIVVSPLAPSWFRDTVESTCRSFRCEDFRFTQPTADSRG